MKKIALALCLAGIGLFLPPLCRAVPTDNTQAPTVNTNFQVKVLTTQVVELGGRIEIGVYGQFGESIKSQLNNNAPSIRKNLKLYLNGVVMNGLTPVIMTYQPAVNAPGAVTNSAAGGTNSLGRYDPVLVLQYTLDRDSYNTTNREAWDTFLRSIGYTPQEVEVGVGLNDGATYLAASDGDDGGALRFHVRPVGCVALVVATGVICFFLLMWWALSTTMLREGGAGTAYSLGKTQMAFWGLLVALSFLGVWVVIQRMEHIPSQVLVLLGISGTTGLGSILIGSGKRATADGKVAELQKKKEDMLKDSTALAVQKAELEKAKAAGGEGWDAAQVKQLALVDESSRQTAQKLAALDEEIKGHEAEQQPVKSDDGWWLDIISDASGPSFHRFQTALWTIILGLVFVISVATTFSMPEFDTTLLILMGISNGTYLGFKIPEKQS